MTSPRGTIKARRPVAGLLAAAGAVLLSVAPAVAVGSISASPRSGVPVVLAFAAQPSLPKCIPPECRYASQ